MQLAVALWCSAWHDVHSRATARVTGVEWHAVHSCELCHACLNGSVRSFGVVYTDMCTVTGTVAGARAISALEWHWVHATVAPVRLGSPPWWQLSHSVFVRTRSAPCTLPVALWHDVQERPRCLLC